MIYAYTRVSTQQQGLEAQEYGIRNFAKKQGIKIDEWYDEKISGAKKWEKRALGKLMKQCEKGDAIIATEISRFSRSFNNLLQFFSAAAEKGISIKTIKENFSFDGDGSVVSKALLCVYGLVADLSRMLCSQRVTEGLKAVKAQGKKLGRPVGSKNKQHHLEKYSKQIESWLSEGRSRYFIRKKLHCHYQTLNTFLKLKGLYDKYHIIDWEGTDRHDIHQSRSKGYPLLDDGRNLVKGKAGKKTNIEVPGSSTLEGCLYFLQEDAKQRWGRRRKYQVKIFLQEGGREMKPAFVIDKPSAGNPNRILPVDAQTLGLRALSREHFRLFGRLVESVEEFSRPAPGYIVHLSEG